MIRADEFNAAAGELRQALDPMREFYQTLGIYSEAVQKGSKQRTEDERFAVYVQSLFGWLTCYIHDDEESIRGCVMDRAAANQALGAVAGLLHRLAHDHATANVWVIWPLRVGIREQHAVPLGVGADLSAGSETAALGVVEHLIAQAM